MLTDKPPRHKLRHQEYLRSDDLRTIKLSEAGLFQVHALRLEQALISDSQPEVKQAATTLSLALAETFQVQPPLVRVLGSRPLKVSENSKTELFGDYELETARIRLWMRTAVHKKPTAFGTLLSTLCHEFCHHMDVVSLGFPNTFHTRGFYERAALLYHHIRGTPFRQLIWVEQPNGAFRLNWAKTMHKNG